MSFFLLIKQSWETWLVILARCRDFKITWMPMEKKVLNNFYPSLQPGKCINFIFLQIILFFKLYINGFLVLYHWFLSNLNPPQSSYCQYLPPGTSLLSTDSKRKIIKLFWWLMRSIKLLNKLENSSFTVNSLLVSYFRHTH